MARTFRKMILYKLSTLGLLILNINLQFLPTHVAKAKMPACLSFPERTKKRKSRARCQFPELEFPEEMRGLLSRWVARDQ